MKQRTNNPERESRIFEEVLVDCYDYSEEQMAWYYYFTDTLLLPVIATIWRPEGAEEAVEILSVDENGSKNGHIRLGAREIESGTQYWITPREIAWMDAPDAQLDVVNDWLWWHGEAEIVGGG